MTRDGAGGRLLQKLHPNRVRGRFLQFRLASWQVIVCGALDAERAAREIIECGAVDTIRSNVVRTLALLLQQALENQFRTARTRKLRAALRAR